MKDIKEFHINKENFDSVIQRIPFSPDTKIIFDDEESSLKFNAFLDNMECPERLKTLVVSETYMKCFHNGYFSTFRDCAINCEIQILNPNFGKDDPFKGTTKLFGGLNGTEDGHVDITPLVHTAIMEMKDNPGKKIIIKVTGWGRQLHFNKELLSTPIPKEVLDAFKLEKKDES